MVLEIDVLNTSDPAKSIKIVVLDPQRIERFRNPDAAPVVRCIVVLNKDLYFMLAQVPPSILRPWDLRITMIVFILSVWEIFFGYEIFAYAVCRKNGYYRHVVFLLSS
jgi:hypothetical protein